jgi:YggT family protein
MVNVALVLIDMNGVPPAASRALRAPGAVARVCRPRTAAAPDPMRSLLILIDTIIEIYVWILIASAVLSWLIAFGVVNTYNRFVNTIGEMLYRLTEPVLRPIRSFLPNLGGVDISPMVLILLLFFLRNLLYEYFL